MSDIFAQSNNPDHHSHSSNNELSDETPQSYPEGFDEKQFGGINDGTVSIEVISEEAHEQLWEMYADSFKDLQEKTPTLQIMHKDDFRKALADKEVIKSFRVTDGRPTSMLVYAPIQKSPEYFPWNSLPYFEKQYPEDYAAGRIFYFVGLFTTPEYQKSGNFLPLVDHLFKEVMAMHPEGSRFIYDTCQENQWLAQTLHSLADRYFKENGEWQVDPLEELGTQTYYGIPMSKK